MTINFRTSLAGLIVAIVALATTAAQPANLLVYNTNDSGTGSLRQRIADNATLGGGNTILFSNIVAGTITLTGGELLVSNNITILGPGTNLLAVNGAGYRVMHVSNSVVFISGLTITNGSGVGPGSVPNNGGGGIYSESSALTLSNCVLTGNSANSWGGGLYTAGKSNGPATVTLSGCTVSGNFGVDGGGIYNSHGLLNISGSTFRNNSAHESGGGISNDGENGGTAMVTVVNSIFEDNSANYLDGGGIENDGQYSGNAILTVINCSFNRNRAVAGGAIENLGFTGNATLMVVACLLNSNSVSNAGGGIYNHGNGGGNATVAISNSTIIGNSANVGGGAIWSDGTQGTVTVAIVASTLFANPSSIFNYGYSGNAMLKIGGTILVPSASIQNTYGTVSSQGYNLCGDGGGGFFTAPGDQINTDPMLGVLADNGGPTLTMALKVGSPAIDKGKSFGLGSDQRGQSRYDNPDVANATGGDGSDIGAYEATELRMVSTQKTGNHLRLDFTSQLSTNYEVQSRSDLMAGNWAQLVGSIPGNGGIASITVSNVFGVPKQFYRVHPIP